MANHGYMSITGKAQGLISAGCSTQISIGNKCHSILQSDAEPQKHLAIRYRDITWTHHAAGTSGYDTWGNNE